MRCGNCVYTDGCVYTSLPPQVKCIITGEFHYYNDECNCKDIRDSKAAELEHIQKMISEPIVARDITGLPNITWDGQVDSEYLFPGVTRLDNSADVIIGSTRCLICGDDIYLAPMDPGYQVCTTCQKAIKFIKEKFKTELEHFE